MTRVRERQHFVAARSEINEMDMLNTEDFILLAGDPKEWDDALRERVNCGEDLAALQLDQYACGRESAELVEGVHGWYVRAGTTLMEPSILANVRPEGTLDGTLIHAGRWGIEWAQARPADREFYVRKSALRYPLVLLHDPKRASDLLNQTVALMRQPDPHRVRRPRLNWRDHDREITGTRRSFRPLPMRAWLPLEQQEPIQAILCTRLADQQPTFADPGAATNVASAEARVEAEYVDGTRGAFEQTIAYHSPSGMEFGYAGSGPADLALNILACLVPVPEAWRLHQDFKSHFIAGIDQELGGRIEMIGVRVWIMNRWASERADKHLMADELRDRATEAACADYEVLEAAEQSGELTAEEISRRIREIESRERGIYALADELVAIEGAEQRGEISGDEAARRLCEIEAKYGPSSFP